MPSLDFIKQINKYTIILKIINNSASCNYSIIFGYCVTRNIEQSIYITLK